MKYFWLLGVLLLAACGKEPLYQEEGYVFGTRVEVSVYGAEEAQARKAITAVMNEFQRLHDMLHAWKPSELSALNQAIAQGKVFRATPELGYIVQDAAKLSAQSDNLFNPAIGGLVKLWGFHADEYRAVLPDATKIVALVALHPQMDDLRIEKANPSPALPLSGEGASPLLTRGGREGFGALSSPASLQQTSGNVKIISRNKAVQLDLGGYAKGYALDRAASILKQQGISNALINIGGNILALGNHGKRAWRVGIQHPRKAGPLATLELHDGEAIGTSGDYQRYFEVDGKRYCHLIDPRSGQPASGVQMVTIVTRGEHAGVLSDAASKPLFIDGAAGLRATAERMHIEDVLLLDAKGDAHLSASMQKRLEFTDKQMKQFSM